MNLFGILSINSMKHTIIYLPGLGDHMKWLRRVQRRLFAGWRAFGVRVEFFPIEWSGGQQFDERLSQLLGRIDELHEQGMTVSLVGASAGGNAAIAAYAQRQDKIAGVVTICGALQNTDTLPEAALKLNPRFKEAAKQFDANLDSLDADAKSRIMTYRPYFDAIVLPKNAMIDGAKNRRAFAFGHLYAIGYCLNAKSYAITRFLKRQSRRTS